MSLANVEKIEREIFRTGSGNVSFTVKSTVLTGRKGKDNIKLDAIYNKNYSSQKYSNRSELTVTTISTSDFIVFAYNNFEQKINEEIYISFPSILDLKNFCNQLLNMVLSKEIFNKNNTVNVNYKEYSIVSQPLGGSKVLVAIPTSIQRDQNLVRGVYLFFNDQDKYIELDVKSIFTLNEIIKNIDLLSLSNSTLIMGMLANMNISEEETYTPAPKNTLPPRNSFFANRSNLFSKRNEAHNTTPNITETDNAFEDEQENSTPMEQNVQKPSVNFKRPGSSNNLPPRTNNNATTNSDSNLLSFNNIMNEAENIDFVPESDEDIEF